MERATQGTARRGTDDIGERRPARFLGSLSGPVREELLSIGSPWQYPPGKKILEEGESGDYLVLLKTGQVKVTRRLGNGHEALIAIRVGGDVVGEMAVMDDVPRSATVTACDDIDACVVQGQAMRNFLDKCPEAAIQVVRLSNRRLRTANSWRIAFGEFPVRVRLARVLAELAEDYGKPVLSYTVIGLDLTHTELAALIGARRETVQKTLASFRAEKIITTGSRRMEVIKLDRLRAIGLLPTIGR
ncbi:Crp/Fnr family transcriptional regulator [Kitasatospora kifunensis]|uniref:CRP-like cAMP-binding protein n=1 Tax=Kitasatospora kifunensis TaxID=58351 RepID=A0A7W7VTI2_KITKI|nr:Crp/Fnr family transcriptional regulator [Kitasatospora kifunensis]MBB4921465.1 CRP-like cAMP-binding protein [Kitasatospora kifunensis]